MTPEDKELLDTHVKAIAKRLERQSISINGRNVLLQSGMSVSGNIKLRERTVMSIFTDMFSSSVESLKFVR